MLEDTLPPMTFAQEEMEWGQPTDLADGGLPRMPLQSQGSLRLRSQASLKGFESSSLLHHSSPKINLPTASVDAMQATGLRTAIRSRLQDLDSNQDGVIETEELVSFIESVISTENRLKQLKLIAGLLIVFMGVFMAATFGLTYVVADLHKDTISMAGAMMDKATGDVLRTAQGGYMELNYTAVNVANPHDHDEMVDLEDNLGKAAGGIATATRASVQGVSGRRLQQATGAPSGTISRENAETGCRWLTEGNININLKVLDLYGSHYPAGGATVADAKGCRQLAQAPNSRAAISGTIVYHKITYTIGCQKGASRCSIRYKDPAQHPGHNATTKGRRLSATGEGISSAETKAQCSPVEIGGVWMAVEKGTNGDCPACFPATATATLESGKRLAVSDLAIGDVVQVVLEDGTLAWSPVFLFPHFEIEGANSFLRLTTTSARQITLSADHFAYVAPSSSASFSARQAVAARDVSVGDHLWVAQPGSSVVAEAVVDVQSVTEQGLVNPFTIRGNIVVDGVVASVYNDAMGSEASMHSFVAAGRALWQVAPSLLKAAHSYRIAQPISLSIGRFFSQYLRVENSPPGTALQRLAVFLAAAPSQLLPAV